MINVRNFLSLKLDSTGPVKGDPSLSARHVLLDTKAHKIHGWYRVKILSPQRPLERLVIEAIDQAPDTPVRTFEITPGKRFAAYIFVGSSIASLVLHLEPCNPADAVLATLRPISPVEFAWRSLKSPFLRDRFLRRPIRFFRSFFQPPRPFLIALNFPRPLQLASEDELYQWWIARREAAAVKRILALSHARIVERPTVSILMTLRDPRPCYLRKAMESVMRQTAPNWELCIAADVSTSPAVRQILSSTAAGHKQIKLEISDRTGEIADGLNTALALSSAPFAIHLGQHDMLSPFAVQAFSEYFGSRPDVRLAYSDDDRIDENDRRFSPYFKPEFSRELLYSSNYFDQATAYHADTLRKIGGWRGELGGAKGYDANLRMIEVLDEGQIGHIPAILYRRRERRPDFPGVVTLRPGADPHAVAAGRRALEQHLARRSVDARVEPMADGLHRIRYGLPEFQPKVSIIIPFRDRTELLRQCISSVLAKTTYSNYEIILVDNGSIQPATADLVEHYRNDGRIHVLSHPSAFNYSALNNRAAEHSGADYICLLNNDTVVMTPDWLEDMVGYASQPDVGCVGAKLLYPNGTIQHAGIVINLFGVTRHVFAHRSREDPGYFGRLLVASNYSAVTAACLLVKRSIYMQAGGLDENELPVTSSDIDFCLKVRSLGYRNVVTPFVELVHFESSSRGLDSTPEKILRFEKEMQVLRNRHSRYIECDPCYSPHLGLIPDDFSIAVD